MTHSNKVIMYNDIYQLLQLHS